MHTHVDCQIYFEARKTESVKLNLNGPFAYSSYLWRCTIPMDGRSIINIYSFLVSFVLSATPSYGRPGFCINLFHRIMQWCTFFGRHSDGIAIDQILSNRYRATLKPYHDETQFSAQTHLTISPIECDRIIEQMNGIGRLLSNQFTWIWIIDCDVLSRRMQAEDRGPGHLLTYSEYAY